MKPPRLVIDFSGGHGCGKEYLARQIVTQLQAAGANVRLEVKLSAKNDDVEVVGATDADIIMRTHWK